MEGIGDAIAQVPVLDATLFGVAALLGLVLRYGRASFRSVDERHTFFAAGFLGALGALLVLTQEPGRLWQVIALQGIALGAAVLVVERVLRGLAGKVPFLPADDQYVKPKEGDTP